MIASTRGFPQASFIPVKGMLSKANKLFDPRSEVLKEIFGDEPDAFPTGEFAEESWLDVLVDVGLRNKLDRQTILQCATKVLHLHSSVCFFVSNEGCHDKMIVSVFSL